MRVVQLGIGGMGNAWIRTIQNSDEVELVGCVEIIDRIADEQAEKYNLDRSTIYSTVDEALDALKPDAVIDVTPPQFHAPNAINALRRGIPVMSEKPLSHTLESAQQIVDTARETGVLHMVAQNYRYRLPLLTLKHTLQTADLGAITSAQVDFYKGPHFGGFREEMDYPLVIDMSIHHFDLMRYLLNANLVSVYGQSWNPPWSWFKGDASASVTMQFENDIRVIYNGSWVASGQETSWNANWRIDCERGVLKLTDDVVTFQRKTGVNGFNNTYEDLKIIDPLTPERTEQAYLLHEFYEAVTHGKSPATTCFDNIQSLSIGFNIVKSFKSGGVVFVE